MIDRLSDTGRRFIVRPRSLALVTLLIVSQAAGATTTPEQACEAGQNQAAGKLAACLAKAQKKHALDGDAAALNASVTACTNEIYDTWDELEQQALDAGSSCPGTADRLTTRVFVQACVDELAEAVNGGSLPLDVTTCNRDLADCNDKLAGCVAGTSPLPATGQTTKYGPGSDGDQRSGLRLSYTDNGNGTITDNVTGLMWEKKDDTAGIHGRARTFEWGPLLSPAETIVTEFLATLNSGGGFAGYTDWRIPNIKELNSLIDYEAQSGGPMIDRAFHATTCAGCTDINQPSCSCTGESHHLAYCSSTMIPSDGSGLRPSGKLFSVRFDRGDNHVFDYSDCLVRAVRGGL